VPSARRELKKRLSTPKVPKVPTPLNVIAVELSVNVIRSLMCNVMDKCCAKC